MILITKDKARELAIAHVQTLELRGFRYEFVGISSSESRENEWGAIFDVFTPSGNLMDGPAVFVIDKRTGQVGGFKPK